MVRLCKVTVTEIIFPEHANHYGTLFGGNALSMMAKAAFVAASGFAKAPVVLAGVETAAFNAPVQIGETLHLDGEVTRVGRSSMTVCVTGWVDRLDCARKGPAMNGQFAMVAVDEAGRPKPIEFKTDHGSQA